MGYRLPLVALALVLTANQALSQQGRGRYLRNDQLEAGLGDRFEGVAQRYGLSSDGLREIAGRDRGLRSDDAGTLHYVCAAPGVGPIQLRATTAGGTGTVAAGPYPAAETFLLHSRPTSTKKLYLDFNGHTTTGTGWNNTYAAGANIVTPAFDMDGSPTTFSATETDRIQLIWQRVREDYAPFNIDVTTEDPGVEALRRTSSTDQAYGVRMCIGGSSQTWFGQGAGGVAYLGSFNWSSDTPAFVFTTELGGGNEKYTAEAISHEAGHTLGLSHDGQTNGTEYYGGHNGWAPIMGVGYYSDVVQWSKGEYSMANNLQDDLAVMGSYGATILADDVGNTTAAAMALSGSSFNVPALIGRGTDLDMFQFNTGTGTVSFQATTAGPSANLDAMLAIYNASGSLVTTANPTGLNSALTANLAAGTYFLSIDGVGTGNATTGYSDYASLGNYVLTGTVVPTASQSPIAVASSSAPVTGIAPLVVAFSSAGSADPDGSITSYTWSFGDGTANSTAANPSHSYSAAGMYTATLTVVDNTGLTASASVVITVQAPTTTILVANIAMSKDANKRGTIALAEVMVKNTTGLPMPSATVRGSWSGLAASNQTVTTDSNGIARFASPRVRDVGTFYFTVTGVSLINTVYSPSSNIETTDSISVP
jgi:PKD repeat protein